MLLPLLIIVLIQSATHPARSIDDSKSATTQASVLMSQGKYTAARDLYEAVLTNNADNAAAQEGEVVASERLAIAARSARHMDAALGHLLQARKLVPGNPRLLYDLGVLEDEIGLYQEAAESVSQLLQLNPSDYKAKYLQARIQLDRGQLAEAQTSMTAYLAAQPSDATAHYGLGRIYQLQQNNEEARKEFTISLDLQPSQTESQYQLADISLKSGDYQQAILESEKVLARNPRHGGALTVLGTAQFRLKNYVASVQTLKAAITAAPDYQTSHYYLGLALARLNRKHEADEQLALASKMADEENKKSAQRLHLIP